MHKLRLFGFALLTLGLTWGAHADEKRYVSDDLITYIHSGPGNQFRIVGTLNSGDEVTLKNVNNATNYGQIVDSKGRDAWIPLDQLSTTPSLRTQVPNLQQQVKTLTDKLTNIDNSWNQRTAEMQQKVASSDGIINGLKKENQDLKNQLIVAQKKVSAVNVQLDDKQRTIILQWFMYGGGVAGVGLILGLLLPHLVPRRKKKDRWMS
ncbi:MAG: TIGR04211 family SH3 domain-containing protein [Rouxiella aceris]|jgi:SH3 domain protein|uniref:SH3 domain-containing protein n=1 Tax=Rouxiella aceris TaxID=2703884 RepID=A0A848MF61_9GAMM|nr:TIGR04211 family SH3 domain-containing protein [Rouxiella aceris]MDR3434617.1 TIGR04211 family SH3 domain-containing protein [Rouxiella aceris]NMP25763.1 SH3 domain-containing protein [Rouxiella aceris]